MPGKSLRIETGALGGSLHNTRDGRSLITAVQDAHVIPVELPAISLVAARAALCPAEPRNPTPGNDSAAATPVSAAPANDGPSPSPLQSNQVNARSGLWPLVASSGDYCKWLIRG